MKQIPTGILGFQIIISISGQTCTGFIIHRCLTTEIISPIGLRSELNLFANTQIYNRPIISACTIYWSKLFPYTTPRVLTTRHIKFRRSFRDFISIIHHINDHIILTGFRNLTCTGTLIHELTAHSIISINFRAYNSRICPEVTCVNILLRNNFPILIISCCSYGDGKHWIIINIHITMGEFYHTRLIPSNHITNKIIRF